VQKDEAETKAVEEPKIVLEYRAPLRDEQGQRFPIRSVCNFFLGDAAAGLCGVAMETVTSTHPVSFMVNAIAWTVASGVSSIILLIMLLLTWRVREIRERHWLLPLLAGAFQGVLAWGLILAAETLKHSNLLDDGPSSMVDIALLIVICCWPIVAACVVFKFSTLRR